MPDQRREHSKAALGRGFYAVALIRLFRPGRAAQVDLAKHARYFDATWTMWVSLEDDDDLEGSTSGEFSGDDVD
ncbi:MAG: hypothetical protein U0271_39355 [Polyangiaceae bacterium]